MDEECYFFDFDNEIIVNGKYKKVVGTVPATLKSGGDATPSSVTPLDAVSFDNQLIHTDY